MDLSLFNDVAAQAPQAAAVCKPIIKTVVKSVPYLVGVKYTTAMLYTSGAFALGGLTGWLVPKMLKKAPAPVVAPVVEVPDVTKA